MTIVGCEGRHVGLPQHFHAAVFVRRLTESLLAGEGLAVESKWFELDAHCSNDEALRHVLECTIQAATEFLTEAPLLPSLARQRRLRMLGRDIRSWGDALLSGATSGAQAQTPRDLQPWTCAVQEFVEALGATAGSGRPGGGEGECDSSFSDRPDLREPGNAIAEDGAPSPRNRALQLGLVKPDAAQPLWRLAIAYFSALEACLRCNDPRRAGRPLATSTARMPPHCRETIKEVNNGVAALICPTSGSSVRTAAAASLGPLLQRLVLQVQAADPHLEIDGSASVRLSDAVRGTLKAADRLHARLIQRRSPAPFPAPVRHAGSVGAKLLPPAQASSDLAPFPAATGAATEVLPQAATATRAGAVALAPVSPTVPAAAAASLLQLASRSPMLAAGAPLGLQQDAQPPPAASVLSSPIPAKPATPTAPGWGSESFKSHAPATAHDDLVASAPPAAASDEVSAAEAIPELMLSSSATAAPPPLPPGSNSSVLPPSRVCDRPAPRHASAPHLRPGTSMVRTRSGCRGGDGDKHFDSSTSGTGHTVGSYASGSSTGSRDSGSAPPDRPYRMPTTPPRQRGTAAARAESLRVAEAVAKAVAAAAAVASAGRAQPPPMAVPFLFTPPPPSPPAPAARSLPHAPPTPMSGGGEPSGMEPPATNASVSSGGSVDYVADAAMVSISKSLPATPRKPGRVVLGAECWHTVDATPCFTIDLVGKADKGAAADSTAAAGEAWSNISVISTAATATSVMAEADAPSSGRSTAAEIAVRRGVDAKMRVGEAVQPQVGRNATPAGAPQGRGSHSPQGIRLAGTFDRLQDAVASIRQSSPRGERWGLPDDSGSCTFTPRPRRHAPDLPAHTETTKLAITPRGCGGSPPRVPAAASAASTRRGSSRGNSADTGTGVRSASARSSLSSNGTRRAPRSNIGPASNPPHDSSDLERRAQTQAPQLQQQQHLVPVPTPPPPLFGGVGVNSTGIGASLAALAAASAGGIIDGDVGTQLAAEGNAGETIAGEAIPVSQSGDRCTIFTPRSQGSARAQPSPRSVRGAAGIRVGRCGLAAAAAAVAAEAVAAGFGESALSVQAHCKSIPVNPSGPRRGFQRPRSARGRAAARLNGCPT